MLPGSIRTTQCQPSLALTTQPPCNSDATSRLRSSVGSDSNHLPDLNEKWLNLSNSPLPRMPSSMKNLERFRRFCCSQLFLPTFDRARIFFLEKNWCFLYTPASNRRPTSSFFEWKLLDRMPSSLGTLKRSRRNGFPETFIKSFDRAQIFLSSYTRCILELWARLWFQVHIKIAHIVDSDKD